MNKILLLDENLINKIAAGEVVERPASVVKELAENSIDAGASALTVEIKDGGVSYLRVTDNGSGIPKNEVETAFLRHATSKIKNMDDLVSVMSLGFRGEALSSIASVSQTEMLTKPADQTSGCRIVIEGGAVKNFSDAGCADGTTVIIKNLFYNTPARLKFLKKPSAEAAAVSEAVNRIALMHPAVSVKYIANSQTVIQTGGRDLKTAVMYVYGKEIADRLIEVNFDNGEIKLSGYIGKPEIARGNRGFEHFFVNGRYIKSELASAACESVYRQRMPAGKFPFFVLHMALPPEDVDVNVHPAKLEARFKNEEDIFNLICEAAAAAIGGTNLIPQTVFYKKPDAAKMSVAETRIPVNGAEIKPVNLNKKIDETSKTNPGAGDWKIYNADSKKYSVKKPESKINLPKIEKTENTDFRQIELINTAAPEKPAPDGWPLNDFRAAGQIFNTYWILEIEGSVYLLDQHAAHERLNYERLLETFKNKKSVSQRLLTPAPLDLTRAESAILNENLGLLAGFGFEIEEIGPDKYILLGVPFAFDIKAGNNFFTQILDGLKNIGAPENLYETKLEIIARISCKASVKGSERLTSAEAESLVKNLSRAQNPYSCPHGRPTIIEITRYELERRFKRA